MINQILYCSECFLDEGLKLDAFKIGIETADPCPHCNKTTGRKFTGDLLGQLSYQYFVKGSVFKTEYGAAPVIQFNDKQITNIDVSDDLKADILLLEKALKVGFFYYGPRLWMIGEIEPLKMLQSDDEFTNVAKTVINEYPTVNLSPKRHFYRLRRQPTQPEQITQYDSSPVTGSGRFDDVGFPVLYGSQDFEVCIHECRATVEDDLYIATLEATHELKLLDLTAILKENNTEFESVDLALQMLFYAPAHSHQICRKLAKEIKSNGFDGVIYPSYFSTVRTGAMPFETVLGMSIRKLPLYNDYSRSQIIPNIALFGRPIAENKVKVKCINRVVLNQVRYDLQFGPLITPPKINIQEFKEKLEKDKNDIIIESQK